MDNTTTVDNNILASLLIVLGTFSVIIIIVAIIWYVFSALGFYKLAKNRGITYAWISWIPICQNYILGDLIGNKVWGFGYANWILVIGSIISSVASSFSSSMSDFALVILLIYSIAFYVYYMTALYDLYKIYTKKPVLLLVLSIFLPFLSSIFIFSFRNHQPNMVVNA